MKFDEAYIKFIEKHTKGRQGERLRRLKEGHGHAEKMFLEYIWWPAMGSLDHLHPEYEVSDYKDGLRFIDFAFFIRAFRIAIEIDGCGTHIQKASRSQHSDHILRQNHLVIDGWRVIRFTYDDIKDRPKMCMQTIQQLIGKLTGTQSIPFDQISVEEKEILRLSLRLPHNITPADVCKLLKIENQKARKMLKNLLKRNLLIAGGKGNLRVKCYQPYPNLTIASIGE